MAAELDINEVIRKNFKFLQEQMVYDTCETRLRKEYGENWPVERTGKTLQEIAKDDGEFKLKLESIIGEIQGVDGWHFQTSDFEFPTPSAPWISKKTGFKKSTIEGLNKNKRFLVEELIAIAEVFNTSIQSLLMPSVEVLEMNTQISFSTGPGGKKLETETGRWFLWLHNLKSLPSQQNYLFERHNSYIGLQATRGHGNADVPTDDLLRQLSKSRYGTFSEFEKIENYRRIPSGQKVDIGEPHSASSERIQLWTIRNTLGLFVELRKLLREETVRGPIAKLGTRHTNGQSKIRNHITRLVRILRYS